MADSGKKPMTVLVVGGSLGGLFAGIVLKRTGHNVRILERNPTSLLQNQGAGVVAGGDTQAFFSRYDLTKTPISVATSKRHYLDHEGNEMHQEGVGQKMTSWDLLYYVMRANFDSTSSPYCSAPPPQKGDGEAIYDYGHTVTSVSEHEDGVKVEFETKDGGKGSRVADLVVAADGPGSTIRSLLEPSASREYVGYVAWRGTVPESQLSPSATAALVESFTFFHSKGLQYLSYLIPGTAGTIKPGERLLNWVWYSNYPPGSPEYAEIMTDADGVQHNLTLPVGKMDTRIWERQKTLADMHMPPQCAEVIKKTEKPFIQAITDVIGSRNAYYGGKLLLLGDAAAGFRPHTAASTSQAAYYALQLEEMLEGRIDQQEWEERTMRYSREVQAKGVRLGQISQFGKHPAADDKHPLESMARS